MDAKLLASLAAIVLSLAFSYIPGLHAWYDPLSKEKKSLIMLALIIVVAGSAFGLSCSGWWSWVSCDQAGVKGLIEAIIWVAVANQTTFLLSPKPGE